MAKTDKKVSSKGESKASSKTPTKSKTPSSENSPSKGGSSAVLRYKDIKFTNVEISELNKEKQPLSYIKYNGGRLLVQADWMSLTHHGIPLLATDDKPDRYHKTDDTRQFIKIPIDVDQKSCMDIKAHFDAADKWAQSKAVKKKLFKDKADQYRFIPTVKTPDPIDEDKKKPGKDYPIIDYIKMRFHTDFNNGTMLTRVNRVDQDKKRTPITVQTVTDIANEIGYKSNIKFVFYYSKIWADKTKPKGSDYFSYGLGLKVMVIDFEPNESMGGGGGDVDCLASDDEGGVTVTRKLADSDEEDSNSEASDPSDNDDDDEPPKASPKKPEPKSKAKPEPESDDEESSEDKPVKASPKKPESKSKGKAKPEPESEDEDSEEAKPAKSPSKSKGKSSKTKSKKSKPAESDDEDDSGEEIRPVKKADKKKRGRN